jgi:hypothetical protein
MEKDSPFGYDQGGNPTYNPPRVQDFPVVTRGPAAHTLIAAPSLDSENPFVRASREPEDALRAAKVAVLDQAAVLNERRVRELIALARSAQKEPAYAQDLLERIAFGLGALLPRVNIRIRVPLEGARSLSGKNARKAA